MAEDTTAPTTDQPANPFAALQEMWASLLPAEAEVAQEAIGQMVAPLMSAWGSSAEALAKMAGPALPHLAAYLPKPDADPAEVAGDVAGEAAHWADVSTRLQAMWLEFQNEQALKAAGKPPHFLDPAQWLPMAQKWYQQVPLAHPEVQRKIWEDAQGLWEGVLGSYGIGPRAGEEAHATALPRHDKRFADARWRDNPFFALVHQAYLMVAEQMVALADSVEGLEPEKKEQLRFATRVAVDALSPDHFPLTNPLVLEKALETRGESLVKGLSHLLDDLRRGQLTHTDPNAFRLGENIAATPGKVVHESRLYQLIQYTPTTDKVMTTPLVIFPPWINRFYILDLNPRKSFVKWALDQGLSVFMVSWKSADASIADVTWDDYIAAEIEAIDVACQRLKVPSAHTIGYCVAGTTLAATLAVLARKGEQGRVASATFFTAQVDFEKAGDLKNFIDDQQIAALQALATDGFIDGRYLAATFNLLRGNDLIWNYVVQNYLLGEDYPAFDLLYWNGDSTNLPAGWHSAYLKDLYRDNRLVVPDSLSALGVPIDLTRITTPCYIQAGREDHIAPAESVWRFLHHLPHAPHTFLLAGSGHIAGVVNPPAAHKYQYWTNGAEVDSLAAFMAGASEHPGSWWPHWLEWLRGLDGTSVSAKGKRVPGGRGDKAIEEAPGSFVRQR
ncbi:MAG TPA: alpha/beta fold hydrolase [Novosphingobium sp.]|nr:alpha/beta fold hydrolase [Novosphingobium sp.]